MAKLANAKHEQFCHEYCKDLNASQAYMRAYPDSAKKSAQSNAARLMENDSVRQRISELKGKQIEKLNISSEMVLKEIADVAFANIGLVCDWDDEGKITLKDKEAMGERGLNALSNIQAIESYDKDGNLLSVKNKFTMNDKLKALELLSKHLGLLDGNGGQSKNNESVRARLFELVDRIKGARGTEPAK